MELIFFIELLLQISVVVILGLGLWIINQQIKISNEHFKSIKTLDGQVEELQKTVKEQCLWNKRSGALAYSLFKSDSLRNAKIRLDNAFGNLKDQGKLPLTFVRTLSKTVVINTFGLVISLIRYLA
jgi:hypothetical protein